MVAIPISIVRVEAPVGGQILFSEEAQVPLANCPGDVALILQVLRQQALG